VRNVVEHTIEPHKLLPKTLGAFDLVTAFRAQFNYNAELERLWNLDEWSFFLDDLRDHVLRPGARFALRLGKQEHKGNEGLKRSDSELTEFMESRGAKDEAKVLLFTPLR
jgi:hypothetical protein